MYNNLLNEAKALVDGEHNFITNASNISALIFEKMPKLNWVGFYMMNKGELVLGPFQGKVACIRIAVGKGVCGTSILNQSTILVDDVHQFPGHIACDSASNSEIVVPMIKNGVIYGLLDVDSPILNRFTKYEQEFLESIVDLILNTCDMEAVYRYYN